MSTHDELIARAAHYLRRLGCTVIVTDMASGSPETPDAIGWKFQAAYLIECKASRGDFLADAKKHFRRYPKNALGSRRYYAAPAGMIKPDELPDGWGLLEPRGNGLGLVREAREAEGSRCYEISLLCSVVRRLIAAPSVRGVMAKTYVMGLDHEDPRACIYAVPDAEAVPEIEAAP